MKPTKRITIISFIGWVVFTLVTSAGANELQTCGYHSLPLVMEQLPDTSGSWYSANNDAMWLWNQYMDIYRTEPSDGSVGDNSDNEFAGWMTDDTLFDEYGFHWDPGTLAVTAIQWALTACSRIRESDIIFNPAYTWTADRDAAEDNPDTLVYYDAVLLHEMGHSWGYQTGGTEDYDYDEPTVMHAYNRYCVQDHMTIHAPDAYHIRRNYDDQISIPPLQNMVVTSKYADIVAGSWYNTFTDLRDYYAGDLLSIFKLTLENTGTVDCTDVHVRIYLSADRDIDVTDILIGDWAWANFAAETYGVYNITDLTIPRDTPAGTYNVGVMVTVDGYAADDLVWDDTIHIWNSIDVSRRSLSVTQPNGGELWYTGSNCRINWSSVGGGDRVKIELSRDSGSTWETIDASTPNDGTYFWYPSGPVSATCEIRITSIDHPWLSDRSDDHFVIAERMIYVTHPNTPAVWVTGTPQTITWTSIGIPETSDVRIDLSRDSGSTWEVLSASTLNDGAYQWTVTGPPSSRCRVMISSSTYMVEDTGNADFTIAEPYLTVTAPNGGENFYVGATTPITWHSLGAGANVNIALSRDSGATWEEIAGFADNTGSFLWTVTAPHSNNCRIRVTGTAITPVSDTSNADFTISSRGITVTSPNGAEVFLVGASMPISWDSVGAGANVQIAISRNGGATWQTIHGATPNDGLYSWPVVGPTSAACRIRVTGDALIPVSDMSDADFVIGESTLSVTSPNGGEVWPTGDVASIEWTSTYVKGNVKIELTRNGGLRWTEIATDVPAAQGGCTWRVTSPGSDRCAIRITSIMPPDVLDTSDAPFTITTCDYDIYVDGRVDELDLAILASQFGRADCGNPTPCEADVLDDLDVDGRDLAGFISEFGEMNCY